MKKLLLMVLMTVGLGWGRGTLYNTTIDSVVYVGNDGIATNYYDVYVTRYYKVSIMREHILSNDSVIVIDTSIIWTRYITKPAYSAIHGTSPAARYNRPFDSVVVKAVSKPGRYIIPKGGFACSVAVQYKLARFDIGASTVYKKVYFDVDSVKYPEDTYWRGSLGGDGMKDSFDLTIVQPTSTKAEIAPAKPLTTLNVTKTFDALGREVKGMKPRGVYFVWDGRRCVRKVNLK